MRLAVDAAHEFGGVDLDRSRPISFLLDGRRIRAFAGDTVLTALLAADITTLGAFGGSAMGLTPAFPPLIRSRRGDVLPADRTPAADGLELTTLGQRRRLQLRQPHSLGLLVDALPDPPWLRAEPEDTLETDLLVVGGGVAGLAAAEAASAAGRRVVLAERRTWLGGDARYFGPVGDEESPEAVTRRLLEALRSRPEVRIFTGAEAFSPGDASVLLSAVETEGSAIRARVIRVAARRVLLATGARQRLPVFPGNRLPGVIAAIDAYHLAKRFGVCLGGVAVVATQSNYGYRLAMRLNDAGVAVRRIVDPRIHPQSRFVDFAKASGLTLASGQTPLAAGRGQYTFAPVAGSGASVQIEAAQLVVAGPWQPELTLWMQAGGSVDWSGERRALVAAGVIEHVAIAGSAAGYRSMRACVASGRAAQAALFGERAKAFEDNEPGTALETPEAPTPIAPAAGSALPAFLDSGRTLVTRPPEGQPASSTPRSLSLGDVAALVELGQIASADAGAIAEERGAPGPDLVASDWAPAVPPETGADLPAYLARRFGDEPQRLHLIVDHRRTFPTGALVYSVSAQRTPEHAIGVVVASADPGGIAVVSKSARRLDRFIIETETGPSPARPAPPR